MSVSNPLQPGVYRIDLPCELAPQFGHWRRRQRGKVHVINLEDGPNGTARISFACFGRPGAFPFGKLGHPTPGRISGAMPEWSDVVEFMLAPATTVQVALGKQVSDFLVANSSDVFKPLSAALLTARANMAIAQAQLEAIKAGTSPNATAAVHNAIQLTRQSTEQILAAAGHIPIAFEKNVVNDVLGKLHALEDAIVSAPAKALHAVAKFPAAVYDNWLKPFVLPAEIGLLGVAALVGGGYLAYQKGGKVDDTSKGLMLVGAAVAILGGGTLAANISNVLPRDKPP